MKWLWAQEFETCCPRDNSPLKVTASALSLCSSPDTWGPRDFWALEPGHVGEGVSGKAY